VVHKGEAPLRQIAKDFGITEACLHRWLKIADREGGVGGCQLVGVFGWGNGFAGGSTKGLRVVS
jgi:hypothetical protein